MAAAKAFQQPDHAGCPIPLTVQDKAQKISSITSNVLTVQFPDRAAVDRFFADVLVMHEDAAVRDRRLGLMAILRDLVMELADISEVGGERGN